MVGWTQTSNRVRVIESRPRDHVRNLSVQEGDVIGVGHRNQQYPGDALVHPRERVLRLDGGVLLRVHQPHRGRRQASAYDAAQLTVFEGEELDVLDVVGEWLLCRNDRGIQGWVPRRILEDVTPGDS